MSSPMPRRFAVVVFLVSGARAHAALAAPEAPPAEPVGGELRPASSPGITGRMILDGLLVAPRALVNLVALVSTAAASFLEDQQVVPRVRSFLRTDDGKIRIAPTLSLASGFRPDVGARLVSRSGGFASMLRGSIVDLDTFLTEGRLLQSLGVRDQTQLFIEGYQERNPRGGFGGLGPDPANDPRNSFLPGHAGTSAAFLEHRERIITGVSARVSTNVEVLLSSSFQRRQIDDPRGSPANTIAATFAPDSVAGAYARSERFYTEAAVRRDTRAVRGPPSAGLLLEGYTGTSEDAPGEFASAVHAGAKAAWFISVVRKTTIVSPSFALDIVSPFGEGRLPFKEYQYAGGFRGSDGRVDRVAALASLDHRWQIVNHVATRLFLDATNVAPRVSSLRTDHLMWAVGFGVDVHTDTSQIGRVAVAYSPGSVRFFLTYGLAERGFGDRQHR